MAAACEATSFKCRNSTLRQRTRLTARGPKAPAEFRMKGLNARHRVYPCFRAPELRNLLGKEWHEPAPGLPRGWPLICRTLRAFLSWTSALHPILPTARQMAAHARLRGTMSCGRGPSFVRSFSARQGFRKAAVRPSGIDIHDRSISFAKQMFGMVRVSAAEKTSIQEPCGGYRTRSGWTTSRQNRSVT